MGRRQFPEGLYTSISQVKCWLRCPRQFELKYVRGLAPEFVPVNLAFGSAIHEALAAYYGELKSTRLPLRQELLLDVFRSAWETALDGDVPVQSNEEGDVLDQVVDKGVSMLQAFHEQASKAPPFEVELVEHGFSVPLHDPDSQERLEESLTGFMDLVIVENGRRFVVEHKTSSRRYTDDQLRFDLQVSAYRLAARKMGLGEDVGLRFQVITKTRIPLVQIADLERDHEDEDDFVRTAVGVLRAIDGGVSYPVRGWQCRSCPYAHACTSKPALSSARKEVMSACRSRNGG